MVENNVVLTKDQIAMLERIVPGFSSNPTLMSKVVRELKVNGGVSRNDISSAFVQIFTRASGHRCDTMKKVDSVRSFYLVDVILSQIAEDSLTPDTSTGDILTVYSEREDLNREIKKLQDRIDFDSLVMDVIDDLLAYGEYTLKAVTHEDEKEGEDGEEAKSEGLLALSDTVDQGDVIPISSNGEITEYLVRDESGRLSLCGPDKFVSFVIGRRKIRVKLEDQFSSKQGSKKFFAALPRFIRIGRSVIYPILQKVRELELLEQIVPASKLSKLLSGTLIGVQMSSGTEIDKAIDACQQIEGYINNKIGIDVSKKEITVENLTSSAGKFKVVPILGDKGRIETMNYQSEEPDDLLQSTKEIRRLLCDSVGVPYEIIFGSEDGVSRGEILKRYARYLRKLKAVQRAVSDGIRQAVAIHLVKSGYSFNEKTDIKIDFRNKLIDIDNLDQLEFADATVAFLGNINTFISTLAETYKDNIKPEVFLDFLSSQLKTIGLGGVVESPDRFIDTRSTIDKRTSDVVDTRV